MCLDAISRQQAIDALDAVCDRECEYSKQQRSVMCGACRLGSAFDAIDELPSAETRMKGKWIYGENDCQDGWFCSVCGFFIPWDYDYYGKDCDFIRDFHVCPHCKAEMVTYTGKKEDTDE